MPINDRLISAPYILSAAHTTTAHIINVMNAHQNGPITVGKRVKLAEELELRPKLFLPKGTEGKVERVQDGKARVRMTFDRSPTMCEDISLEKLQLV